jgi:hypothetical protein
LGAEETVAVTKRQADLLMRLVNLASAVSIEAHREHDEVVRAHLRAAVASVEAACSLVRKAGA